MGWRMFAALGLIVVGVGAVAIVIFGPTLASSQDTRYVTSTATVRDVVDQVVATGAIAPSTTYGLAFGSKPHIVASTASSSGSSSASAWQVVTVNVAVGAQVTQGDILATADTTDAQAALELAQANLDAAQARLDTDSGGPSSTDQQSAQISVDQAQNQLTSAQQSRDETKQQNQIKLGQAQDAVTQARQQLNSDRAAAAPDNVIAADQANLTQARNSLNLTQIQIKASNRQANDQVASAQLALESAQNGYTTKTAPASAQTLATDRSAVLQTQTQVADAQTQLDNATMRAPVDGTVTAVDVTAGTLAPSGDGLYMIGTQMQVSAAFAESDLPSLAVGQPATVNVTATTDQLTGTVSAISPLAATSGSGTVVSYTVTVALDSVPATVRPGMSTNVAVTIASATNVVAIPAIALVGSQGSYSVRVLGQDGQATTRSVDVGLVTASLAEIRSGIAAGDVVITGTASSLNSTTTTGAGNGFPGGGNFPGGGFRGLTGN